MRWLPLLLALVAFGGTLAFDFVHDDVSLIATNADLSNWSALATAPLGRWMGPGYPYYRPLAMLSYGLDAALFGRGPAGHHAVNVLLAGLAALTVFALARARGEDERTALAAGCLFALHPVHAEAVGWVSSRADLLAALGALGAWVLYARGRTGLALALFFAALASKESAAALPLVLVLMRPPGEPLRRVAPFFLVLVLWLAVRAGAVGPQPFALRHQLARVPRAQAAQALASLAVESGAHLAGAGTGRLDFTVRRLAAPGGLERAFAALACALLVALAWRDARAGWGLATLACFAPLAGLLLLPGSALLALRYLYLPSALVALGLARVLVRATPWAAVVVAALFAARLPAALAPLANARALWSHEVQVSPSWSIAHGNLGLHLLAAGELDAAEQELTLAVALAPGDGRPPVDALFGLGRVRLARRDPAGAAAQLEAAYTLNPNYPKLAANLGYVYLILQRPAAARAALARAVELDPRDETSRRNLEALRSP